MFSNPEHQLAPEASQTPSLSIPIWSHSTFFYWQDAEEDDTVYIDGRDGYDSSKSPRGNYFRDGKTKIGEYFYFLVA